MRRHAPELSAFIRDTYGTGRINHVVVTHPDRDHAEGLAPILEAFDVDALWMLRPWNYAAGLLPFFHRYQSVEAVAKRLHDEYPYIYELENIAVRRGIPMYEREDDLLLRSNVLACQTKSRRGLG